MSMPPFHLAFPVSDLEATRTFFVDLLGCGVGRESERWIDFDFYGHQITAHLLPAESAVVGTNPVDGKSVPVPHFGAILEMDTWHALADKLKAAGVEFLIGPYVRFEGEPGEQATMFFRDPSGNCVELKAFQDTTQIFARE